MRINRRRFPSQVGCSSSVARRRTFHAYRSSPETEDLDALRVRLRLLVRIEPTAGLNISDAVAGPDAFSFADHVVDSVSSTRGR